MAKNDNTILFVALGLLGVYLYINRDQKPALIAQYMKYAGIKDTDRESSTGELYKDFLKGYSVQQLQAMVTEAYNGD